MSAIDTLRMDWLERNPERVYMAAVGGWWIRPLREDGSVEYNTHPTAAGAPRAVGPFPTFRAAIDDVRRERSDRREA